MPDVGIVLPVYVQRRDYLRAAIRSIRNQLYRNFKLVIVIDGVTPAVQQVVRMEAKRDKRIQVIAYAQNKGTEHALNVGFDYLNRVPGIRYLTWVASDNIYHNNFIKVLRRNLRLSPDHVGLVYSSMKLIQGAGQFLSFTNPWQNQPKEKLLDYNFIYGSFMYKKKYAAMAGVYEHTPVEDYDYWLKLTEHCGIKYVPRALVTYRMFAPLSNSLKIKTDPASFRFNRYKYQLVKHLARMRRGLAPETSIIFSVNGASEQMINRLEELLNQNYSNYRIYLIDTSPDGNVAQAINAIPDPRIDYVSIPFASDQEVRQSAINYAITPFVFFYSLDGERMDAGYLENMAARLRAMPYVGPANQMANNQLYMSATLTAG
ncbi:glycosyltransferase family 2 protein [Paenibacillus harenae]|uniref:Glycosyltransferase involved in cell wall biosynthesis n=1 Tax=Paenibacillus harenae TaxID=306543 RepID=A0ABT9U563_PAEHA|nr:glycosyltransferase family 2 protein [Paenibacillus harenae]MDQ0114387.1 glycosyltransferase involved in cell wall biosynthesis [Paenibacillus harenae]